MRIRRSNSKSTKQGGRQGRTGGDRAHDDHDNKRRLSGKESFCSFRYRFVISSLPRHAEKNRVGSNSASDEHQVEVEQRHEKARHIDVEIDRNRSNGDQLGATTSPDWIVQPAKQENERQ